MLNDRLLCEIALLSEYKTNHKYLRRFSIVNDDVLKIEFVLNIKHYNYEFLATFNRFFPNQPIEIIAKTAFFSTHKYKNGAMCLKWGQDNWNREIRLVDLIDNIYELLYVENPLGKKHDIAESGDSFTFGQTIKRAKACIIIPLLPTTFKEKSGELEFSLSRSDNEPFIIFIKSIGETNYCQSIGTEFKAHYCVSETDYSDKTAQDIREALGLSPQEINIVFCGNFDAIVLFRNDDKLCSFRVVTKDYSIGKRLSINNDILNKRIAIIGLGSIGSRVAFDLARAGFDNFYLVDDDVFMPYNVVRSELTFEDVGDFKVDMVSNRIKSRINQNVTIETSTLAMTGQESSTSTNRFITKCLESSLIIDCTADDRLLMLLSEPTKKENVPVISGTVIPGGLGNIILAKKAVDDDLESILASYYQWKADKNIFAERINDYSASISEQTYIATMSDCSILSGLIGKMAISILEGKADDLSNINIFSTSNYCDLQEPYRVFKINANELEKVEEEYNRDLVNAGKIIYEDYCSKRDSK